MLYSFAKSLSVPKYTCYSLSIIWCYFWSASACSSCARALVDCARCVLPVVSGASIYMILGDYKSRWSETWMFVQETSGSWFAPIKNSIDLRKAIFNRIHNLTRKEKYKFQLKWISLGWNHETCHHRWSDFQVVKANKQTNKNEQMLFLFMNNKIPCIKFIPDIVAVHKFR